MCVCVSVRLPFAWHTVLSSYFTLSLARSFFLSMVSLVGLGLARFFFRLKKTEIEIFFNSCKVKNSSIWWCVAGGGGGIGDIRPPFCWGLHKIKGVCVCVFVFFSLSLHFTFWDALLAWFSFVCVSVLVCETCCVCLVVFFCLLAHIEYFLWVDCFFLLCGESYLFSSVLFSV